jgi:dTDP-4-amino-4,6-dideoxygalactose transaminase
MSATATAILVWNAIPIFADIETETFGLAPEAIAKAITPRTKAILVTDIFGHAARIEEIVQIARKHNLKVIEDVAQAPGARIKNRFVGLHADIGVFSLNYHKHIQTGEGGVCVTNDPVLCERMQLIRNHAESVVEKKGVSNLSNMIGFNFRMGEIEAAIGIEQLRKLKKVAQARQKAADYLSKGLRDLRGLRTPVVRPGCSHVYYIYPLLLDLNELPVGREAIAQMLKAEGIPGIIEGYVNVHRLPMYQKKIAYGSQGFPWKAGFYKGSASYEKGICPNAEELQDRSMMGLLFCAYRFNSDDLTMVIEAFRKVWRELDKAQ